MNTTMTSPHVEARVSTLPRPLNPIPYNGTAQPAALSGNERITVALPKALVERLRNAVYWTEGRTMAAVITDAIESALAGMEDQNGDVFPARLRPLRPGRRRQPQTFSQSAPPPRTRL